MTQSTEASEHLFPSTVKNPRIGPWETLLIASRANIAVAVRYQRVAQGTNEWQRFGGPLIFIRLCNVCLGPWREDPVFNFRFWDRHPLSGTFAIPTNIRSHTRQNWFRACHPAPTGTTYIFLRIASTANAGGRTAGDTTLISFSLRFGIFVRHKLLEALSALLSPARFLRDYFRAYCAKW